MEDFKVEMDKWITLGNNIVILGKFDMDVCGQDMVEWWDELELRDTMIDFVGADNNLQTYQTELIPIDSMWCSPNVIIRKYLYLLFGAGAGDYRPLIINIHEASLFDMIGA